MSADRAPSSGANTPPQAAQQTRPQWLVWALASGGFAAFNGVFAKLTTTSSTSRLAQHISTSPLLDYALRAVFFALNLLSNAIMWFLFTRALTAASSTVRVSILNTSANFIVTAMLGMLVFGEGLPAGWWLGATMLIAGSVVIGGRESQENREAGEGADGVVGSGGGAVALPLDGQASSGPMKGIIGEELARKHSDSVAGAPEPFTDEDGDQPTKRFTDREDDDGRRAARNS